jgi:septin 7
MADSPNGLEPQNGYGNGSPSPPAPPLSGAIRKKLMGYVGFSNLPNQVHRRSVRKGFNFTAMVVGMFIPPTLIQQELSVLQ